MENKDYIGRVIHNEDPTFSGRCKVRVFGLFDDLDDANVPWFVPISSSVFSTGGSGSISIPKINDIVRVRFQNGDYYSGEYTAIQNMDPQLIEEIKNDYEGTTVLMYDSEEDMIVIFQKNSGIKMSLRGSTVRIAPDGVIQLQHQNNLSVVEITNSDINIATAGTGCNINVTGGNQINISAPVVNVESNAINIGNDAQYHAVKGEKLIGVLTKIVSELATKTPYGSTMLGQSFSEILSTDVMVQ